MSCDQGDVEDKCKVCLTNKDDIHLAGLLGYFELCTHCDMVASNK